jgi:hypothetical protein
LWIVIGRRVWLPIGIGRSFSGLRSSGRLARRTSWRSSASAERLGYRRLRALVDHGLLTRARLVYGQPAQYVATREGRAWAGMPHVEPARVGVATTRHWALCARLAVILERRERVDVWGEPRLRAAELEAHRPIASAAMGNLPDGRPRLRRPDLVLFPPETAPVAVEVELSVKAARRLAAICRAWARCRIVSEVRYYAPPRVARAVLRAVSSVHASDAIRVLSLEEALEEAAHVRFAA